MNNDTPETDEEEPRVKRMTRLLEGTQDERADKTVRELVLRAFLWRASVPPERDSV